MRLHYPPSLPISERRQEILEALSEHQCLIVLGDTGSGKTTQLPKLCIEAGRGLHAMIGCTQPRRIAALAVAERLAEETGASNQIGCKIRFHDQTSPATRVKFMTDGILLAETRNDRLLRRYDTLIIDEAHERSLNIDFILGYLNNILPQRPDLKLIISSATIDAEKFSRHFNGAPVLRITGRTYPISTLYHSPDNEEAETSGSHVQQAIRVVEELLIQPGGGDILVFMPTERDITDTLEGLSAYGERCLLLPLYSRLSASAQRAIFRKSNKRKIIVATNVAETSLTVPGIFFVVDSGLARVSRYNPRSGATDLRVTRISQASCEQRRGRCGRVGPGCCIRLYSEEDFLRREAFTLPEIQRANLAEVILRMIALQLGDPAAFPFIDPPPAKALRDGYRLLTELGAISGAKRLTKHGKIMARLPLDPRISRILIEGAERGALRELIVIAAALSIQDPRLRPPEQEHKADEAHRAFSHPQSDFLSFLNIWNALHEVEDGLSNSRLSRFCKANFLSWQRMREWLDLRQQIEELLAVQGIHGQEQAASYSDIHCSLSSGLLRNICQKKEKNAYLAAAGREVIIFPGSGLHNKGPQWAIAAEFIETSQLFARTLAAIDPDWLEALGGPLCKRSWSEPHWEKRSGRVVALERVSLFGLLIVAGRKVDYGRMNERTREEARQIFIRSALIEGQLGGRHDFLAHNLALRSHFEEMEERLRRRGIVADEEAMHDFYTARLEQAYDRFSLQRLIRKKGSDNFLRMSEEDICRAIPDSEELYRFPPSLRSGGIDIPLRYHFNPGAEDDGVSAVIPQAQLSQINPQVFEWLTPGLLPEKITLLAKRLPKRLRRVLAPLPEAVDRLLDALTLYGGSLYQELERVLARQYQLKVLRSDWQPESLPPHLRMRFVLLDEQQRPLAHTRVFNELLQYAATHPTANANAAAPAPRPINPADFDHLEPALVIPGELNRAGSLLFPTLRVDADHLLHLNYVADEATSRQANRLALERLYTRECAKEAALLAKLCKQAISSHSGSWLALGTKLQASALQQSLYSFLLNALYQTASGRIPSQTEFGERKKHIEEQGLIRAATPLLQQVIDLIRKRRELQTQIHEWARRAQSKRHYDPARHQEYEQALERIAPSNFLDTLVAEGLAERLRYLQALALRIERAEYSPQKDAQKAERLSAALQRLSKASQFNNYSCQCLESLRQYEIMLEEFRVSVFAPELGTPLPVSEERLRKKWLEVEHACQRLE